MWKLKKQSDGDPTVLSLSGWLEREELTELQEIIASEAANQNVALDLNGVKLVDHSAVAFLCRCESSGVELRNCPAYIREWIARMRPEDEAENL